MLRRRRCFLTQGLSEGAVRSFLEESPAEAGLGVPMKGSGAAAATGIIRSRWVSTFMRVSAPLLGAVRWAVPCWELRGPLLLSRFLYFSGGLSCHLRGQRHQFDPAAKKVFDLPRHEV